MSFLDQCVLAKDGRLEKMTLLLSVPTESPTGTLKKFPYPKPGYEIRVQSESRNIPIFLQSENKFIVLIIDFVWPRFFGDRDRFITDRKRLLWSLFLSGDKDSF